MVQAGNAAGVRSWQRGRPVTKPAVAYGKPSAGRRTPEAELQRATVALLQHALPPGSIVHHSANEQATKQRQAILVGMGVFPGFSDLIVISGGRVMFLEAKSKTGTQQPSQREFQRLVETQGFPYAVFRSVDQAVAALRKNGFQVRVKGNATWPL